MSIKLVRRFFPHRLVLTGGLNASVRLASASIIYVKINASNSINILPQSLAIRKLSILEINAQVHAIKYVPLNTNFV